MDTVRSINDDCTGVYGIDYGGIGMNYTEPNWKPIETLFKGQEWQIANYMWMYDQDGISHYKHRDTRRYIRIDQQGELVTTYPTTKGAA